jgi:tripartite-type tricarboxylate transporter receptor subunit TctC
MSTQHPSQTLFHAIFALSSVFLAYDAVAAERGYPNRSIRFVVPTAPGGGPDVVARMLSPRLTEELGQQVVIDNRAGANALIGADVVAKAPADGYTWLFGTGQNTVNPSLVRKMPHDMVKDFAPVTLVLQSPYFLVVHPSLPVKSVSELVALAKSRPGKLNFGSGGVGSAAHLSGEMLKVMAKIDMTHVPYKGVGLALSDLVGGHLELMFPAVASGIPYHKAGRLRGLGVTSPQRHPSIPDVPAIAEAGLPGYQIQSWYGVFVPAGTPQDVVVRINEVFRKIVNAPDVKQSLVAQGTNPETNTPAQFGAYIKDELQRAAMVVKAAGVQPE